MSKFPSLEELVLSNMINEDMSSLSDEEIINELTLRDIYYSADTGFRSSENIYKIAKKERPGITRNFVKTWLQGQKTYQKFKKSRKTPPHFLHTFVRDLGEQVQVDLVIQIKHKDENQGYQYILMAIEILSRYAFAVPLKNKSGESTREGMEIFLEEFKEKFSTYPQKMQADEGREFDNKDVLSLLESKDIKFFTTNSVRKATIVERLNGTIKTKILKLFETNENHDWISHLSSLIQNYNTQENRSIGMTPADVNESNKYTVWGRLYGHVVETTEPKFEVGDRVRVRDFTPKFRGKKFQEWYKTQNPPRRNPKTGKIVRVHAVDARDKPPFSEEIFEIRNVLIGDPIVYKLYSPESQLEILGKFYESELSLVR